MVQDKHTPLQSGLSEVFGQSSSEKNGQEHLLCGSDDPEQAGAPRQSAVLNCRQIKPERKKKTDAFCVSQSEL